MRRDRKKEVDRVAIYVAQGLLENFEPMVSGHFDHLDLDDEEEYYVQNLFEKLAKRLEK